MDARTLGLILVWLGTIALVAVLQHRIRTGAWTAEGLDNDHPVGRWSVRIAAVGIGLAALGAVLTVASFL
jgi:hypothetical protein